MAVNLTTVLLYVYGGVHYDFSGLSPTLACFFVHLVDTVVMDRAFVQPGQHQELEHIRFSQILLVYVGFQSDFGNYISSSPLVSLCSAFSKLLVAIIMSVGIPSPIRYYS